MECVLRGLRIAPFEPMKPKQEAVVKGMGKYNFKKIACNHCSAKVAKKHGLGRGEVGSAAIHKPAKQMRNKNEKKTWKPNTNVGRGLRRKP